MYVCMIGRVEPLLWPGFYGAQRLGSLRYAEVSKETYSYGKRDLFIWQKRPITISIPQVC